MLKNVRKRNVVNKIAELTNNTRKYTSKVVEQFLSEIMEELAKGNRLEFRGFGVFEVVTRKQKRARNPKTKEEVIVPPQKTVKFKMGKEIKKIGIIGAGFSDKSRNQTLIPFLNLPLYLLDILILYLSYF